MHAGLIDWLSGYKFFVNRSTLSPATFREVEAVTDPQQWLSVLGSRSQLRNR